MFGVRYKLRGVVYDGEEISVIFGFLYIVLWAFGVACL